MGSHKGGRSNRPHLMSCVQDCTNGVKSPPSTMHPSACSDSETQQHEAFAAICSILLD